MASAILSSRLSTCERTEASKLAVLNVWPLTVTNGLGAAGGLFEGGCVVVEGCVNVSVGLGVAVVGGFCRTVPRRCFWATNSDVPSNSIRTKGVTVFIDSLKKIPLLAGVDIKRTIVRAQIRE